MKFAHQIGSSRMASAAPDEALAQAGKAGSGQMGNYTVYVNPYLVLKSGGYTKHYYIEGLRINGPWIYWPSPV